MKIKFNIIIVLCICYQVSNACTIIIGHKNGRVLVGNNEDWYKSNSKYWFENTKSNGNTIKTCFFGFDGDGRFPQGGINDHGLFFDGTFTSKIAIDKDMVEKKKLRKASIMIFRNVLKKCKNIEEAESMLEGLYFRFIETAQVVIVDKHGSYLIIKANGIAEKGTIGDGEYKIITNFHLEELESNNYTCYRFDLANKYFNADFSNTVDEFENVLSLTHQEYPASTVYSNVFDLSNSKVNVFYNNYFDNVFKINLKTDFKRGEYYFENIFKKRMIDDLIENYTKSGMKGAIDFYDRQIKSETKYIVDQEQLIDFAEYLSLNGKLNEAKKLIDKNIELYPKSDKNYEALGRIFLRISDIKSAVNAYRKVLELNPENWWANDMIEQYVNNACKYEVTLEGYPKAQSVKIEGDFNEWMPIRNVAKLEKDVWISCIRTKPGKYKYRFIVDGKIVINSKSLSTSNPNFSEIVFE